MTGNSHGRVTPESPGKVRRATECNDPNRWRFGSANLRHPQKVIDSMPDQRTTDSFVLACSVAAVLFAGSALADNASVTVTGSRLPQTAADEMPTVDVVTRADIDARQPRSSVDLLRDIPGVWADQPGGPGSISSVYVRGADPNFTVVLIDGVRVNDSTNSRGGSFDLSALTPDSIERIEVVRGVRSAAYGSDALAGVINIITAAGAAEPTASIETGLGTDGYRRVSGHLLGSLSGARAALTAGVVDYGDPSTDHQLIVRHANAKLGTVLHENTQLSVFGRYVETEAQSYPEESGGPLFAARRALERRDSEQLSGGVSLEHAFDDETAFEFRADASDRSEVVDSPGVAPGVRDPFGIPASRFDSEYTTFSTAGSLRARLSEQLRGVVGLEWRQEQGASDSLLSFDGFDVPGRFDLQRTMLSAFTEVEWQVTERVIFEGALRADDPEGWESQVSPSASLRYNHGALGSVYVRWGEGFKLPSFFALGNPLVGNPQLQPETSRGIETGVRISTCAEACVVELALFSNDYRNLVDFEEGPPPRLVNRAEVEIDGAEGRLQWTVSPRVSAMAHVTYLDAKLVGSDEPLRSRPQWQGGAGLQFAITQTLHAHVQALYVGELYDSSIATGDVVLDPYARADLGVTWRPDARWRLQFAVDNLTDEERQEAVGLPAQGRAARVAVQLNL